MEVNSYFFFSALSFLCLLAAMVSAEEVAKADMYDAETFKEKLPSKPHFVKFMAPWCGHCQRLAPVWDQLSVMFPGDDGKLDVAVVKVDCTKDAALCSDHGVTGYPTLKLFVPDGDAEGVRYKGQRTIQALSNFITKTLTGEDEEDVDGKKPDGTTAEEAKEKPGERKKGEVFKLTAENFEKVVGEGKHFIKFYAPWCGHCQRLAPIWQELAEFYKSDDDVTISNIDCTQHREICKKSDVSGYPTLIWFQDGQMIQTYKGIRALTELSKFVDEMKKSDKGDPGSMKETIPDNRADEKMRLEREERKLKQAEERKKQEEDTKKQQEGKEEEKTSDVLTLDTDDFEAAVEQGGITFVKFFAPWCGHCKRLAPAWEELATHFAPVSSVNIAKVDCTTDREICNKHGVRGFPTLILFGSGGKVLEKYAGQRDIASLQKFITDHLPREEL